MTQRARYREEEIEGDSGRDKGHMTQKERETEGLV
jgi:hypothetical protein